MPLDKTCLRFFLNHQNPNRFSVVAKSNPKLSHSTWEGIKATKKDQVTRGPTVCGNKERRNREQRWQDCCLYFFQVLQKGDHLIATAGCLPPNRKDHGRASSEERNNKDFHGFIEIHVTYHIIQCFLSLLSWGHSAIPTVYF